MQSARQRFERLETLGGVFPFNMRIAVHRGTFLLGGAGSEGHMQQVILGTTLSRLAEVESFAQPGEVIMTAEVAQAIGDRARIAGQRKGCFRVVGLNNKATGECSTAQLSQKILRQLEQTDPDAVEMMLGAYLIPAVYRRIIEDPTGHDNEGEHRHITTMFAHVTGMGEVMRLFGGDGAIQVLCILDKYLTAINQIIDRHGGCLARISANAHGEKLLIIFGAPVAVEKPEVSALQCALEMNRCLEELNGELPVSLQQRIAIDTGNAFCGNVGSHRRREYTVIGDHVNAACRLLATASPWEILLSENVWQKASEFFGFRRRDAVKLKGLEQPINVFQLLAENNRRLAKGSMHGKLIGREGEFARIRGIVKRVLEGEGQVVSVSGEPGIGKTRLIDELVAYCQARGMTCFLGQCDAYGNGTAYLPWSQIVRDLAGITTQDTGDASREKLETTLIEARHDFFILSPLLAKMTGLTIPDNEHTSRRSPRQRKEKIFEICLELLRSRARSSPVLIVLEDVHWIDALSKELLMHVSAGIREHRILVVAVHRTEFKLEEFGATENTHRIHLTPFSVGSTIELLQTMLGTDTVADDLVQMVQQRAQGNPLFTEEMIRALVDSKYLVRDDNTQGYVLALDKRPAEVPATVESLILSRVDRLSEEPRRIIQVASVFGRRFRQDRLHSVLHFHLSPERLESTLREMTQLDLIVPEQSARNEAYSFRHALVQESIYESVSYARRREIHLAIGEELERVSGQETPTPCEELARHFDLGQADEKALKYLLLSGDHARAAYANSEAADYYERALVHLGAISKRGDTPPVLSRLLEDLGDVHSLSGNYASAVQRYQQCLDQVNEPVRRAHLEGKLGGVAYRQGQPQVGIEHLERGLRHLGRWAPRRRWQVRASLIYQAFIQAAHTVLPRVFIRERSTSRDAARAAIEIYESLSRICYEFDLERTLDAHLRQLNLCETMPGSAQMAQTYSSHGIVCGTIPLFKRAIRYQQRGLAIREAEHDRWGIGQSSNFMGICYYWMGCYQQAIACLEHSSQIFREVGDRWETQVTYLILSYVYLRRGELEHALQHARISLDLSRRADDKQGMGWALGALAEVYNRQGKLEDALTYGQRALQYSEQAQDRMFLAVIRRILGEIYLRMQNVEQAIHEMRKSVQHISDYRLRQEYVMGAYSGLAEAYLAAGRIGLRKKTATSIASMPQIKRLCHQGERNARRYPNWLGYAYRVSALCEEAAGRRRAAIRLFRRSIEASSSLGADYELGMTHGELGRFLLVTGDPDGRVYLEKARRIFTICGAAFDLNRIEFLLQDASESAEASSELLRPHPIVRGVALGRP